MISRDIMRQIRRIQIKSTRLVNEYLAGPYESVFKGQGVEFHEVREYVEGDDVRLVDWSVTARTGKPHVKLLSEEREQTVMLVIDASASIRFTSVGQFKNELAAELCAVLALAAIRNNDKVGLIIFTDEVECYVAPGKGRRHVLRLIREVLLFKPSGVRTNIPAALYFLTRVLRRRAIVFLVSDFLADNYAMPLLVTNRRHDCIAVVVEDPREETLPNAGLVALQDAESGRSCIVDTGSQSLRRAYFQNARNRRAVRETVFRQARMDFITLNTALPYMERLLAFFRLRERRLCRHRAR